MICPPGQVKLVLDDLAVTVAAAQDPAKVVEHHLLGRKSLARQQIACRHQHARRADAAWRGAMAMEGALQRADLTLGREAFDRGDVASADLADSDEAGADLRAVEQHGAGATIAGVAADLGADGTELVAKDIAEAAGGSGRAGDGG